MAEWNLSAIVRAGRRGSGLLFSLRVLTLLAGLGAAW